jgi:hypothetical protein
VGAYILRQKRLSPAWDRLSRQRKDFTTFVALSFLLAGLAAFGVAFTFMNYLVGIFGIMAAIFTFLDK